MVTGPVWAGGGGDVAAVPDGPDADDTGDAADAEFVAFVRAASDSLHRTAYLLTGNRDAAQDAVQTALTRVYQAWSRRGTWRSREAYARQVLVNVVLTSRQRRWWGERAHGDLPDRWAATAADPGRAADPAGTADERDVLRRALAELPARQRTAVVLRHYLDLSEAETAAEMGCPVGTVKSWTARGLTALRTHLEAVS